MEQKILMHKNVETAVVMREKGKLEIKKILSKEHLPVGVYNENPLLMNKLAEIWSTDRVIPADRQNLDAIVTKLGMDVDEAYVESLGVSLTDCYWFTDRNSGLVWEDVNFYDNGFDESDFCVESNFLHPDLTTNGSLEKTWKSVEGIPYLLKKGKPDILAVNETVVSNIAGYLNIPCTPYNMCQINGNLWSICPDIVNNSSTEMVSILQIEHENINNPMYALKFLNQHFRKNFVEMLLLHVLVHNTDGHERNISLLRNADTLEYTGFAPAYDNGTCLGSYLVEENGVIHHDKKNDEMKDLFSNRNEILTYIGEDICNYKLPPFPELRLILEKQYKKYGISEEILEIASEELMDGYNAIIQKQQILERNEEEWER